MAVEAFLLCDSAITDAASGKAFVHGIFDKVSSNVYPCLHPVCAIFFKLSLPPATRPAVQLGLIQPNGSRQPPLDLPVPVGPTGKLQGIVTMNGLPLNEPGTYRFQLLVDGAVAAETTLLAEHVEERGRGAVH